MGTLVHANSFRDLLVYQKARTLTGSIFLSSASFPPDELYPLTSQIRRSSRSVRAQIAEAWGKRRYEKNFVSQLSSADGQQMKTQHWLESALDFGYASRGRISPLLPDCEEIGRMLGGSIAKAGLFCNRDALSIRDEQALYFASAPPASIDD